MDKINRQALLEEFKREWYNGSLTYIRVSLILTICLVLFFYPFDPFIVNQKSAEFLQFCRLYVLVPSLIFLTYLTYKPINPSLFYITCSLVFTIGGCIFVYSGYLSPNDSALHVLISLIQTIALMLIALRIPWKLSVPCAAFLYLYASYVTLMHIDINTSALYAFLTGFGAATSIMCISAYLRDSDAIRLFIAQKQNEKNQNEQLEWSKLITRFLRHELGNQITAISTSLSMMERVPHDNKIEKYLSRGQKAVKELRDLLLKTTNATNIEDAVNTSDSTIFHVSELLSDTLFQYEHNHPSIQFNLTISNDFVVEGSSVLLSRALGNLLENSIRHQLTGTPITVTAEQDRTITVSNEGDPLPENKQILFEMGHAQDQKNGGLFGLGLFIVKKIMEAHEGAVFVMDLVDKNKTGASFSLSFPEQSSIS
mgnify:CR=1 FL=1